MPVSVRLSELTPVSPSDLTDDDLFLITDSGSTSSKKVTLGQVKANIFSGQSVAAFDDVDITSTPPTNGQFLMWSESDNQFVPGDISLSSLGELNDVDISSTPPTDGQVLSWDAGNQRFIPQTIDLSAIYNLLGVTQGDSSLGDLPHQWQLDNVNFRTAIIDVADAITQERTLTTQQINSEAVDRTAAISALQTLLEAADAQIRTDFGLADNDLDQRITDLQTVVNNLDIDISPETLNTINELAAALQDDPNIIGSLQAKDTQLEGQITSLSASTATDQGVQDSRLTQLEADVLALGQAGAPAQLDTINELATTLAKLVPLPPTTIAGLPLTITTNAGTARLCVGFTDRTGGTSGYAAGDSIKRNTDGRISTNKIDDIGPGDSGDIVVKMSQNSYNVSTNLAEGIQSVDFMGLKITDNKDASLSTRDSGIAEGFYQTYDIQLVNAYLQNETDGLHFVEIDHAGNKTQKGYFYEDESTPGAPTIQCSSAYIPVNPVYSYSSGVPHYTNHNDNEITYSVIISNLSGEMYTQNKLVATSQTSFYDDPGDIFYTDCGTTNPPEKNYKIGENVIVTKGQSPRDVHATALGNNTLSTFTITTPYGSASSTPNGNSNYLIMGGTARTDVIDEDNILISSVGSGAGNATRIGDAGGDNPTPTLTSWNPLQTPAIHEAIVRGGVLRHDTTDYSASPWYPHGPNLSGRSADPQYFEVEIRRSDVSQFNISYTGSCAGCWVAMADNPTWTNSLSGTNGWADMFQAYRGSGVPTTAEPGCSSGGVMDNNGGTFTCVFGTESSSNDSENRILVRWKLTAGQEITQMSFS